MKQQVFEQKYQACWSRVAEIVSLGKAGYDEDFPNLFRSICHHLAIAKHRRYSPQLVERLNAQVIQAHHLFYQHNARFKMQWLYFFVWQFPQTLRNNHRFVFASLLLFALPMLAMGLACYLNPEFIYSMSSAEEVMKYEAMYDPSNDVLGRERDSSSDIQMFGFYIKHNIGISFQMFAGGMLAGFGSVFYLIFNGLAIGGVAGHLTQLGYTSTFYPFVVGHGSFELTALVFAGAAGLKLGYSIISPGAYSRLEALRIAGRDAIVIMYGVAVMLLIAAFIEAFWSSTAELPQVVKYSVGAVLWAAVLGYCILSGRRHGS